VRQNGGLSVLSSVVQTEKSRVGGDDSHVAFSQKFSGEKRCETVSCRDATVLLSLKFGVKSAHIFTQSP
jgi:hypothetical protein